MVNKKKKRKRIRLNKRGRALVGSLVAILLVIIVVCFADLFGNSQERAKKKFDITQCNVSVDYPSSSNAQVTEQIKKFIDSKKDDFITVVSALEKEQQAGHSFSAKYDIQNVGDIDSIHVAVRSDETAVNEDKVFVYNKKTGKTVSLDDILLNSKSLSVLSEQAYKYLSDSVQANSVSIGDETVKSATAASKDNFSMFALTKDSMTVYFPFYQNSAVKGGVLQISIPYNQLCDALKKEYLNGAESGKPMKRDLSQFKGKKLMALTFDDGPSKYTKKILEAEDKYNARVTFFVVGERVPEYSETLKKTYMLGNEIGSHTQHHKSLSKSTDSQAVAEINAGNESIKKITGETPILLRPPYGAVSKSAKKLTRVHTILWDIDTLDWKHRDKNYVCKQIVDNAHDGGIALMHDLYETSVDGAIMAMEELSKQGYAFVTISEMAELKGVTLDYETSYCTIKGASETASQD